MSGILLPDTASNIYLQDYRAWTKDGLVDFVIVMLYVPVENMGEYAAPALAAANGRHIYLGIGAFRLPPDLAQSQILGSRSAGAPGIAMYSYHYVGPNTPQPERTKLSDLADSVFAETAGIPAMPWK